MLFNFFTIDIPFKKVKYDSEDSILWYFGKLVKAVFIRDYYATYTHDGKGDSSAFYSLRKSGIEQRSMLSSEFLYVDSTMLSDQIKKHLQG